MKGELASALSDLEKAKTEMLAARNETTALQKQLADEKTAAEQLRSEAASAKAFLEAEKLAGAHLRIELALAKDQIANMGRSRASVIPRAIMPSQPLRVVPYGSGTAAIQSQRASPAQVAPARPSPGRQQYATASRASAD